MFTGLIEGEGTLLSLTRRGEGGELAIGSSLPHGEISRGDSIAVNGVCLTVTGITTAALSFDVSPETFMRSTFPVLRQGDRVNLERALRLGDRLGGHIVTGHIDCCATLTHMRQISGSHLLWFTLPADHARHIVEKGSVAINGISLTVNDVTAEGFSVTIIPHTFANTTLRHMRQGDRVNIETDILGKYVERLLAPRRGGSGLNMGTLAEHGFL